MSATLQAAAKSSDRNPCILARFSDEPCERPRFAFSEVYSESHADEPHAACVATDGSIVRWRVESSTHHIHRQRITDPTSASQWSAWTDSGEHVQALTEEVYLDVWCDPANGNLFAAWIDGLFGIGVYWSYSTDHGATWATKTLLKDWGTGNYVGGITGVSHNGASYVFVAVNPMDAFDNSYLELFYGSGTGVPGAAGTTSANRAEIRGIGCGRQIDGTVVLWIADWRPSRLSYLEYVPGSGWGDSGVFKQAGVGSALAYSYPSVGIVEVASGVSRFVSTHVEASTSPSYSRAMIGFSPTASWLTEEVPWRYDCAYGLEVFVLSGYWYFVSATSAYRAPVFDYGEGESLDVTEARIVSGETVEKANEAGSLKLVLDNSDGYFDAAGVSGLAKCVRPGAQIGLAPGLRTSAGRELIWREPFWVTRVEHVRDGKRRVVVVEARDAVGELASRRARRTLQMADVEIGEVLQRVWWRVTGEEITPSGILATELAYFQVQAGESWATTFKRVARMAGKLVRWYNGATNGVGWTAARAEVLDYGAGSSVWTIGGSGSPFNTARWWRSARPFQGTTVEGAGYLGESRDWAAVWSDWRDTAAVSVDAKLDAQSEVDDRAAAERRFLDGESEGGVVRIGLVPGLEVGDVVTVTDELAGVSSQARYVRGMRMLVDLGKGRFESELELEGVVSGL